MRDEAEALNGRADRVCHAAGGSGNECDGALPHNGGDRADVLQLGEEVRRAGGVRDPEVADAARGEPQADAAGGGSEPGRAHPAGDVVKNSEACTTLDDRSGVVRGLCSGGTASLCPGTAKPVHFQVLNRILRTRACPQRIDNGSEFYSRAIDS